MSSSNCSGSNKMLQDVEIPRGARRPTIEKVRPPTPWAGNANARTCWLYSNLLATESGLFINPLTWSSHLHVAHVVLQFIWGDSTFARIELHLSHNDIMQQVWWFKITYEAECKAGFDDHQLVFAFHGHFIMCTQSTILSSFSNRIRVENSWSHRCFFCFQSRQFETCTDQWAKAKGDQSDLHFVQMKQRAHCARTAMSNMILKLSQTHGWNQTLRFLWLWGICESPDWWNKRTIKSQHRRPADMQETWGRHPVSPPRLTMKQLGGMKRLLLYLEVTLTISACSLSNL